jgi:quercetin dioxygenase-like cupin family protein
MKISHLAALILISATSACNSENSEVATTPSQPDTTAQTKTENAFSYDASKDGMLIAPEMTRKLGDTLGFKMYEVTLKAGDSLPLHSHPDHAFYVINGGKAAIYFGNDRQEWELKPGMGFVNGPVSDAAKNIGKTDLKFLVVDVYRARDK